MKHYCKECKKITKFRYLECELHGKECEEIVCCECGASLEDVNKDRVKKIEKDRVILNTPEFSAQIVETPEGIIVDVFVRHGELIKTHTYWKDDFFEVKMSKIQEKAIKEKCPNCKTGKLHEVPNNDNTEMYLWCNNCDLSMDSSGGYIA